MTNKDPNADSETLSQAWHQIDALLDGEPVDREALRTVLAERDARDYLVEALLLRRVTQRMDPADIVAPDAPRRAARPLLPWIAAGAVVAAGAAGGYLYGQQVDASAASIEVNVDTGVPIPAPEPTHAIRFEPGVNWNSAGGD
jgi:hypothetical protein